MKVHRWINPFSAGRIAACFAAASSGFDGAEEDNSHCKTTGVSATQTVAFDPGAAFSVGTSIIQRTK